MRAASAGSNLLLNVGPTALGELLPAHVQRLREMGAWLTLFGESVYNTRVGAVIASPEVVSTSKDNTHYVHVLNYVSDVVPLKIVPASVKAATLLRDGSPVKLELQGDTAALLTIPYNQRDEFDTVVKLTA